ncbi:MAG: methyl-accepting chemotaxis protein [bacterium]
MKRKDYFIKKAFQLKFVSIFLALIVSGSVILGWVVYEMANQTLSRSFYESHIQIKSTWEIIFPAVVAATLLSIFTTGAICVIVVLVFSHRIAGPLYRFEKNLEEIARGNFTINTRLRKTDEFELLADKLNLLTQELNRRIKDIKTGFEKLSECLHPEDSSKNKEIKDNMERLNKLFSQFRL